jgi:SPP1 family predicted phage head-tail adaptor
MDIGKLSKRVAIQSQTITRNDVGEAIETWATIKTVYASIKPLSARELLRADQLQATATTRMIMRDNGVTIKPSYRILWDSRIYDINAINNIDERGHTIELLCTEHVE